MSDPIIIQSSNNPDDMPIDDWQALNFALGENHGSPEVWDMVHRTARMIRANLRRELTAEIEKVRADLDAARDRIDRALALHAFDPAVNGIHADGCRYCQMPWPCATVAILTGRDQ